MSPVILLNLAVIAVLAALLTSRPLRLMVWRTLRERPPAGPIVDRFAPSLVAVGLGAIPWLVALNITQMFDADSRISSALLGITAWLSVMGVLGILIVWLRRSSRSRPGNGD
jgi:hypothetical protein